MNPAPARLKFWKKTDRTTSQKATKDELAVAANVKSASPYVLAVIAPNVIVCATAAIVNLIVLLVPFFMLESEV